MLNKPHFLDKEAEQINFLDQRFYKVEDEYYPSITFILQYYPKDQHFLDWLKQHGNNSDYIVRKAADEGTQTHYLIEKYLKGEEIEWLNQDGDVKYPFIVWDMLLKFDEFWKTLNPKLIHSEVILYSKTHKIGGSCDLVLEIEDKLWVIDIKTSKNLHKSYDLQTAAYSTCYEEMFNKKVDYAGILWLKSSKRKLNKEKKQGKGWELYQSPQNIEKNWSYFEKVYDLFKLENPNIEPKFTQYPLKIKI